MKTQQYINTFKNNFQFNKKLTEEDVKKAFIELGKSFLQEFEIKCNLMDVHLDKHEKRFLSIIVQLNIKWKRVAFGINQQFPNSIRYDAFLKLISDGNPEMIAFLVGNKMFVY